MPDVKLFLLGAFCLERDGRAVRLPTRKAESLLAYLALHPESHAREKLAALFWGDSTDDLARRSLRTALSSLRKELGDEVIIADRESVQFNASNHVWMDAIEFHGQATEFLADNLPESTAINFDLYRGDLLADFYDDWILPERERLQALYLDALLRQMERLRTQGEYSRAIAVARKALATNPTNEQAHQHAMFCYWSLGDRGAALVQFDACQRALRDELGVEPSPDTLALAERIQRASVAAPSLAIANTNLPIPLTSFIGREREMSTVKQLLDTTRLLTLTGVGGCGKTRLAIQVARDVLDQFADGTWWVELAAAREDERVLQLVFKAVGLVESQQLSPLESLLNHLRTKQALLVIDNCEHLVRACAELAEMILSQCPNVRILTTSREALNISGEIAWLVPSLSLPASDDLTTPTNLLQSESVRLFVERAAAIRHDFALTPANARAVTHICRRLDGIPLALELAAARLRALSVEQIGARLDDRFGLLTTGSRTALPRQQTLRATIDWSYELLSSAEQTLLRRLSVFSGGWTLEAAEAVCAGDDVERAQVLDLLTHLTDKSLLIADCHDGDTQVAATRFGMLETVREYARQKLVEAGEFETTSERHLRFFSELAQTDGYRLRGEGQMEAFRQLETEYANLSVAFACGLGQDMNHLQRTLDALRLATSLWHFWNMRGDYLEGYSWLQDSIERVDTLNAALDVVVTEAHTDTLAVLQHLKATALLGQGILTIFRSSNTEGLELFEQSATLAKRVGDMLTLTYAYVWIAYFASRTGNLQAAQAILDECQTYLHSVRDEWGVAWVLAFKGYAYINNGDKDSARAYYQYSADLRYKLGDRWGWSHCLSVVGLISTREGDYPSARAAILPRLTLGREYGFKMHVVASLLRLGNLERADGDFEQATAMFKEGISLSRQVGLIDSFSLFLVGLAHVSMAAGDTQRAARLLGASNAAVDLINATWDPRHSIDRDELSEQMLMDELRTALGDAGFEAAWAEGRDMTLEQAVEEALRA